jgi:hypothetical protein
MVQPNGGLMFAALLFLVSSTHSATAQVVVTGPRYSPPPPSSGGNTCDMNPSCSRGGRSAAEDEAAMERQLQQQYAANRLNAGCQREDMVRNAIVAAAQSGTPIESTVPQTMAQLVQATRSAIEDFTASLSGGVLDPKYRDPSWRKYKVIIEGMHYSSAENAAAGIGNPFIIEVHYWWNNQSRQVDQAKFKNTKEQGCVGQITAVG